MVCQGKATGHLGNPKMSEVRLQHISIIRRMQRSLAHFIKFLQIQGCGPLLQIIDAHLKKRKEKTTQTMSAWVKEVWMPQNLWEAVGPHYRGGGSAPFWGFLSQLLFCGVSSFLGVIGCWVWVASFFLFVPEFVFLLSSCNESTLEVSSQTDKFRNSYE